MQRLYRSIVRRNGVVAVFSHQQRSKLLHLLHTHRHAILHHVPTHRLIARRRGQRSLVGHHFARLWQQTLQVELSVVETQHIVHVIVVIRVLLVLLNAAHNHIVHHSINSWVRFANLKQDANYRQHIVVIVLVVRETRTILFQCGTRHFIVARIVHQMNLQRERLAIHGVLTAVLIVLGPMEMQRVKAVRLVNFRLICVEKRISQSNASVVGVTHYLQATHIRATFARDLKRNGLQRVAVVVDGKVSRRRCPVQQQWLRLTADFIVDDEING
mmetsp:Transcript_41883/g.68945  ORF Transcript_41883/g.68945 Transcript_41883/m.68945 type:complete len:272 (+) Transcript_41883:468-1283(+)